MKNIFTLLFLFAFSVSFAIELKTENINQITKTDTLQASDDIQTLNIRFNDLYRVSTTYQSYKVISMSSYNDLKSDVLDSIQSQKNIITEKNSIISDNKQQITSLQEKLTDTQNKLEKAISLKESRSILGMPVNKSLFSVIIIITYATLLVLLAFFVFKYQQNLGITNKAVNNLDALEIEFEKHKKNSLNRFQEVSRKLQDELNKNWKKEK